MEPSVKNVTHRTTAASLAALEIDERSLHGPSVSHAASTATSPNAHSSFSSTGTGTSRTLDVNNSDPHLSMDAEGGGGGGSGGGDMKAAVLGIIKAMVGPAILYLPHGFVAAGYMTALPIMICATCLFLHSSKCLLEVWKLESERQLVPQQETIADDEQEQHDVALNIVGCDKSEGTAAELATPVEKKQPRSLSYPDLAYRAFGSKGETAVKVGVALMQSGVCLTYLIFVPHNLHSSVHALTGWNIPTAIFLVFMVLVQIPLSWIRDIRKFTTTNAIANALILYGLVLCLAFALAESTQPYSAETTTNSNSNDNNSITDDSTNTLYNVWQHLIHLSPWGDHPILFIGTSVLLFEGSITLLIPLQEAVQSNGTNDRERFSAVYPQVILCIQVFYFFFAVICWMSFGDDVNTVLTTSLPEGFLSTTVQLAYSLAVLFTFPLQNYPSLEIACHSIAEQLKTNPYWMRCLPKRIYQSLLKRNVIAGIIVCLLAIVALTTMESLDKVVSLTGALIGIPIAFMIPPMIHTQLMPNLTNGRRHQNNAVAILGSIAMILASFTTIYQWNDST